MKLLIVVLAFAAANAASFNEAQISGEEALLHSSPPLRDFYAKMGVDDRAPRVVGGTEASKGQFPFVVDLSLDNTLYWSVCGGSIIREDVVLTAAHCAVGRDHAIASAGTNLRTGTDADRQIRESNTLIMHENYNKNTIENDIALIILEKPFILGSAVTAVPLPINSRNDFANQEATVIGWGRSRPNGPLEEILRYTTDRILTNAECLSGWSGNYIKDSMVCLDGANYKGACGTDSGGPLVIGASPVQIGIASFGSSNNCDTGIPTVYTRISSHLEWISSQLTCTCSRSHA